ncbi:hypothetical protein FJY71_05995, partial [candidate division WOR-3 bacterium]|nr:hypothetical protein [candidate division WOR-3 bacterium]
MRRIIALALTSLAAVSFTGCGRPAGDKAGQRPATAVEVEPVRRETVARTVQLLGTLQGESQVTVMSKV